MKAFPSFLIACLLTTPVFAQSDSAELDERAQQLVELRSQVESLQEELEITRSEHRSRIQQLGARRAELEQQKQRQSLAVRQLEDDLDEARGKLREAGVTADQLQPVLMNGVDLLSDTIASSLPFKREARAEALESLGDDVRSDNVAATRAVNRLWGFYEDELRLTRENAMYRQTIQLDGEDVLADVAKVGSMMLFFRTNDERFGYAQRQGDSWQYVLSEDGSASDRIANLFDSLRKQIRQGYFRLPNALPEGGQS